MDKDSEWKKDNERLWKATLKERLSKVGLGRAEQEWKKEKERLAKATLEERRKDYSCGENYKRLEDIPLLNQTPPRRSSTTALLSEEKRDELERELGVKSSFTDDVGDLSSKVSFFIGDITKLEVDAIVSSSNPTLWPVSGVDNAIHQAAGPLLLEEQKTLNGCDPGEAKISCGYRLPARFVISTVGSHRNPSVLGSAYWSQG